MSMDKYRNAMVLSPSREPTCVPISKPFLGDFFAVSLTKQSQAPNVIYTVRETEESSSSVSGKPQSRVPRCQGNRRVAAVFCHDCHGSFLKGLSWQCVYSIKSIWGKTDVTLSL